MPVAQQSARKTGKLAFTETEYTRYVGIVPHHTIPRYCENMFPKCYGRVIDFIHVYDEEMEAFGSSIEWIPEEPARLIH